MPKNLEKPVFNKPWMDWCNQDLIMRLWRNKKDGTIFLYKDIGIIFEVTLFLGGEEMWIIRSRSAK